MRHLFAIAPLLLSGLLCAQYVSPSYHSNTEGLSNNVFPFGTSVPFRYVQIHDDVPVGPITSLAFRHNNASSTVFVSNSVTCDIWLSSALTTSTTASSTFDNNHGANKTQVATAQVFNHPFSNPRIVPDNFSLKYPTSIFVFPGGSSLCWEAQVTARSTTAGVTHDAISGANTSPPWQIGVGGRGCFATGYNLPIGATGSGTMTWTGTPAATLTVSGSNLPLLAPAFHTLGTNPNLWGAIPLPFDLPGTSGSPSRTCSIYNDVAAITSITTTATGTATNSLSFIPLPVYHGITFYSQIWALDAAANTFGLVTSPGVGHNIVAPTPAPPLVRVYLSGSLGATGTVGLNSGLVTKFN